MKTAYLFPGQGAQYVGMGRDLYDRFAPAREVFDEANRILGVDLKRICFEGPEEELRATRNTQPAILVHSCAVLRVLGLTLKGEDARAAGHSLGEYTAYVAAGALSFADGLRITRERGDLMYQAGVERPGTMAAILGLAGPEVEELISRVPGIVRAANLNSPGQVVISGEIEAVRQAMEVCTQAGAKRAIPLEVSGAFHSPLMEGAAQGLARALAGTEIVDANCIVLANATAEPVVQGAAIRASLERQLLSTVRWEQIVRSMLSWGAERFVEIGPGKVLSGLVKAVDRQATCIALGGADQVEAFQHGDRG